MYSKLPVCGLEFRVQGVSSGLGFRVRLTHI